MKYNHIASIFALAVAVSSCNKEDDSVFDTRNVKPVVTVDATSFPSLVEGTDVTLTLTTDIPYKTDMDFKISLVGGNGSFRDFKVSSPVEGRVTESTLTDGQGEIAYLIKFPAYAKTTTVTLTAASDDLPEGIENLILELAPSLNSIGNVAAASKNINMTIANVTSNDLTLYLDWSGSEPNRHGTPTNATYLNNAVPKVSREFSGIDMDFYVYDSDDNPVVEMETGELPEVITLPASTPDGTYYTTSYYYSIPANALTTPKGVNIPLKIVSTKSGVFYNVLDKTGLYTTLSPADGAGAEQPLTKIVKSGATWTILNYTNDEILTSGKSANNKNVRLNKAHGRRK